MIPRLKAIPPSMDSTGSPISSTNGARDRSESSLIFETAEHTFGGIRNRALPECDIQEVRNLKAFIAYDAMTHPDHPLSTGKGGVELYLGTTSHISTLCHHATLLTKFSERSLGTLPNGEKRLMFSSAQIEYIQYWLHAMKLTREPIALPSTEYLIQAKDLQHVSSVVYKDGQEFKKAQKVRAKSH